MSFIDSDLLTPTKLGPHTVPGLWRFMFPEDFQYFKVDPEKAATCFDCPQVKEAGFHAIARCCTVIPRVPNFLLGLGLAAGNKAIELYIDEGMVLPEGTVITPGYLERSLSYITAPNLKAPQIMCPFLDRATKGCRIYAFRNSVCSSFFCRFDQGEAGRLFWEAVADLGSQLETILAQWALEAVGFDFARYMQDFDGLQGTLEEQGHAWRDEVRRSLFQDWFGREKDLFKACAEQIAQHRHELFDIASSQRIKQTKTYDARLRESLSTKFPAHLAHEALPEGEPVPLSGLWYSLSLAHRNLGLARLKPN